MGRGLFSGILWGVISAAIILISLSQLTGRVYVLILPPEPVTDSAPKAVPSTDLAEEVAPTAPAEVAPPATEPSRQSGEIAAGDADAAPAAETVPAATPETGGAVDLPQDLEIGAAPKIEDTATDAPEAPVISLVAPEAPATETAPVISMTAPEPAMSAPLSVMPESPVMAAVDDEGRPAGGDAPVAIEGPMAPEMPVMEVSPGVPVAPQAPVLVEETLAVQDTPTEPVASAEPPVASEGVAEETTAQDSPEIAEQEDTQVTAPVPAPVAQPQDEVAPQTEEAPAAAPEPKTVLNIAEGNALSENGLSFVVPRNRPVMGIVLLEDPDMWMGMGAVARLPFPVTFAIDPHQRGARESMADYSKAGHEIALLADLPVAEGPAAVQAHLIQDIKAIPRAVAIVDSRDAAFQTSHEVSAAVVEVLAHTGHGLLTYSRGQNAGVMVAEREGVPVDLVFRVFDDDGQGVAAIKRFIDQAAFRAQQQQGVVMVGHLRPDTLRALVEWSLENRGSAVTLVPLSVVLKR